MKRRLATLLRRLLYCAGIISFVLCVVIIATLGVSYRRGWAVVASRSWVEDPSRQGWRTDQVTQPPGVWLKAFFMHGGAYVGYAQRGTLPAGGGAGLMVQSGLQVEPLVPTKYPLAQGQASFLGFAWEVPYGARTGFGVTAPLWFLAIVAAVLPGVALAVHRGQRPARRQRRGLCVACGYDLRGTLAGAACPECGAARIAASGRPSAG